ncbi:MAG: molybdopterin molybdotransferase MoeA [Proteobacteria bacterium]|nr:molybdopterin molybdotransferase MoeA [Pseudomonadota bacterium]
MSERTINKDISCMDDFDPESITPDQALAKIFATLLSITKTESLPIRDTLGRILATDIKSDINVPSGRNSAMDGYAINAEDLPAEGVNTLKLIGSSFAGSPFNGELHKGECVRIMTGAIMPEGTDTVVIQEHTEVNDDHISIGPDTKPGSNVRQAGEDLAMGDLVLEKGMKLTPADIGLLASLGIADVEVYRKLKVAFFSTGDELRSIGEELEDGMIYDSNRYTLYGMLSRLGVEIIDMGVVKDDRDLMGKAFEEAAGNVDVLITSGGVSVGEADYVKETLIKHGEVDFWKVAMKPGRPLTFGKLDSTYFFGLPGNPVSVMVTFYQFVQPALRKLAGENATLPVMMKVPCVSRLKKRPGRVEYQRGILEHDESGRLVVRKTGMQGSGILRSMADANCFIVLSLESEGVKPEDMVDVQLFHGIV